MLGKRFLKTENAERCFELFHGSNKLELLRSFLRFQFLVVQILNTSQSGSSRKNQRIKSKMKNAPKRETGKQIHKINSLSISISKQFSRFRVYWKSRLVLFSLRFLVSIQSSRQQIDWITSLGVWMVKTFQLYSLASQQVCFSLLLMSRTSGLTTVNRVLIESSSDFSFHWSLLQNLGIVKQRNQTEMCNLRIYLWEVFELLPKVQIVSGMLKFEVTSRVSNFQNKICIHFSSQWIQINLSANQV